MIAYSIEAAQQAGIFFRISVSTDSEEIAEVAHAYGADVPSLRQEKLSGDRDLLIDVMRHEARLRKSDKNSPEAICFILATAPFVRPSALKNGVALMESGDWDYALAATTFPAPIQRAFKLSESGGTEMLFSGAYEKFSNNLVEAYHDAGQFYWGLFEKWLNPKPGFFGERTTVIKLPRHEVQDIDTPEDWEMAEKLYTTRLN
tara:strand:- start:5222 stop:5830 length:609 start_codon:yes stop_codon:yes gene_type:complete